MKKTLLCAAAAALAVLPARSQKPAPPAFEVASVKLSPPAAGRILVRMGCNSGRIDYANVTLKDLLKAAYGVRGYQIEAPSWADTQRYDIAARIPEGAQTDQVPEMLRSLLADRFRVAYHRETRARPAYALLRGPGGTKLVKAMDAGDPQIAPAEPVTQTAMGSGENARFTLKNASMTAFADVLTPIFGRPVIDLTGIEGSYDIDIDGSIGEIMAMRKSIPGAAPTGHGFRESVSGPPEPPEAAQLGFLFAAVKKLGLNLESRRTPVEYLVIDRASKEPTDN